MVIDIREAADVVERTKEDHGTVYIQGNILQIEWDRPDTPENALQTWTYETEADAQAKFDQWTQGWYQEGVRDPQARNPIGGHEDYFKVGHQNDGVVWLYHDGEIKTIDGVYDHSELLSELGITPKWPAKLTDFFARLHRGRYEPKTGKVSYISLDGHEMPSWLRSKLEEKFGDIEVETFASNGHAADDAFGFNAWIDPNTEELMYVKNGETHSQYAVRVLHLPHIGKAFERGYIRLSFAPRGQSFIQADSLEASLPILQRVLAPFYEKWGSIPIWYESESGEDIRTDLGRLVNASNLEELKEMASNPAAPSTRKILATLEQEGYYFTDVGRLACWMTPDGDMINCSGDGRTRGIDHREVSNVADVGYGNTAGMHRLMQLGFIRLKPEAPGFDVATRPSSAQRRALINWLAEFRGEEIFVEAYDSHTATFDERNEYFRYARHESFEFERGENPGRILAAVESFYDSDEPLAQNPPDLRSLGFSEDVAAYVESIEDKKALGKLFNQIRKRPEITLDEVQALYQPTEKLPKLEQSLYDTFADDGIDDVPKEQLNWIEAQLWRRVRKGILLDIETPRGSRSSKDDLGDFTLFEVINNILDWANNDHVDLRNYTFEQANEAQLAYHEQCKLADPSGRYNKTNPENILYEYENGYTMQLVTSEHDFKIEGEKMGHCVGGAGYFKKFMDGRCKILSLRDEKNEPHVTIELVGKDLLEVKQIQGKQDKRPIAKYRELVREFFEYAMPDAYQQYGEPRQIYDEVHEAMYEQGEWLPSIVYQIIDEHYNGTIPDSFDEDPDYGFGLVQGIEDETANDFLVRLIEMADEVNRNGEKRYSFENLDAEAMSNALLELLKRSEDVMTADVNWDAASNHRNVFFNTALAVYAKTGAYAPKAEELAFEVDADAVETARETIKHLEQYNSMISDPPDNVAATCYEIVRKMLGLETLEVLWEHPGQMRFTDEEGVEFNPPISERLLEMGVHPDVVAYVDTLNEHPKIQGMLFKEFKAGKFEKLADVMAFVESKLPKGPVFDAHELRYIRQAEQVWDSETQSAEFVKWFKLQLTKLRIKQVPQLWSDPQWPMWIHNWQLNANTLAWDANMLRWLGTAYTPLEEDPNFNDILYGIFQGLRDWLDASGSNVNSYSWFEALIATAEWHQQQCELGAGEDYDDTDEEVYPFPDGYRIVKVTSANNLEVEGNKMRHCVGSYADQVQEGTVEIYSLRDADNEPHVTVEVQLPRGFDNDPTVWVKQIQGVANSEPKPKYKAMLKEWFASEDGFSLSVDDSLNHIREATWRELEAELEQSFAEHSTYGLAVHWDEGTFRQLYDLVETAADHQNSSRTRINFQQSRIPYLLAKILASMPKADQAKAVDYIQARESNSLEDFDRKWYYEGDEEYEQDARDEALSEYASYALPGAILSHYETR